MKVVSYLNNYVRWNPEIIEVENSITTCCNLHNQKKTLLCTIHDCFLSSFFLLINLHKMELRNLYWPDILLGTLFKFQMTLTQVWNISTTIKSRKLQKGIEFHTGVHSQCAAKLFVNTQNSHTYEGPAQSQRSRQRSSTH